MTSELMRKISDAKYLYKSQKFQKAEDLLMEVVETNANFADVFNLLGLIAHQDGRFGEAVNHLKKALAINSRYTEAMLNLSILYNDMGEYALAKKLVEGSRKDAKSSKASMDPFIRSKLANKHAEVADWYYGVGAFSEAVLEYQKAVQLEPLYCDIRTKLAISLREDKKYAKAVEELKQTIKTNKKFLEAHVQLGVTYFTMGKRSDAVKTWKQAVKLFPSNATLKMYLRFAGQK